MSSLTTMPPAPASAPVPLDDLLATFRSLAACTGALWDAAYGRAPLAALGPDSAMATWHQERGLRLLLALALVVPEAVLRAQFERVLAPTARAADLAELLRPLAMARDASARHRPTVRALALAIVEVINGQCVPAAKAPAPATTPKRQPARHAPKARARPSRIRKNTRDVARGRAGRPA